MMHKKDYIIAVHNYIIAVHNFSCIKVYKRPDEGSKLEPKHVVMNQLIS